MDRINTVQLKSEYEQNGYVIVRDVLDIDLIKEAQAHVDWLLAKNPGRRPGNSSTMTSSPVTPSGCVW